MNNPTYESVLAYFQDLASGVRRRGDPRTLGEMQKLADGRARAKLDRQKRSIAKSEIKHLAKTAARRARGTIRERLLSAMEPGLWYGASDLAEAAGEPVKDGRATLLRMLANGQVRRAANPAWCADPVPPWRIQAGEVREPHWLYGLP